MHETLYFAICTGLGVRQLGGAVLVTLFFSAGSQELLLVPDTFITQHTLGSVSSILAKAEL